MVNQIAAAESIPSPERGDELGTIELFLLLEALVRWTGYDFRDYAPSALKRRVYERMRSEDVATISALQDRILHDNDAMKRLVFALSNTYNRLLQPPDFFRALRESVIPLLRTYSFVRIWFPACGTGEDVYAVASMLFEAGMIDRCMIYATDLSEMALARAREGTFGINSPADFSTDYAASGGTESVNRFCALDAHAVHFNDILKKNIIFAEHSLATDASLNEFQAIVARGVLPPLNMSLQYRVHNLFLQSLSRLGFLCLGNLESLHATPHEGAFRQVDPTFPIYRRMR
ncbi:MAG: protein-glutamate O-methyltransferase CheR [Candidatus Eremiobacteraeota bacterium]|nr:protein-glutamate O-methyltransferase CheR [Candidatus Eremiobacteraeota bacterium]